MHILKPPTQLLADEPTLEVSLLIPAKSSAHAIEATLSAAQRFFDSRFPGNYEIIVIPNRSQDGEPDKTFEIAEAVARASRTVRVVPHLEYSGKGAALRTGLSRARGRYILFTDADLPYELEFFDQAISRLREGYDLVTGNRRLGTSHFDVPVELLPIAYSRHRLGLGFNRVVRWFFPVQTTDTQAGIKAMTRRLAREAFQRIECPGFFFDLEIFLTARERKMRQIELPIVLFLNTEKSTVRIVRESLLAAFWLSRIYWRYRRGAYA